ncbi:hypothetical protein SASPL_140537 [Salvia splendens]|uniref:Uncharacterized protein n=1 Tax=Salvia splendens TaxID=180675 RepID=A0A8X8WRV6_SALSN|nr:hypothetical protein SASPL_140537 [Salvia splendens]
MLFTFGRLDFVDSREEICGVPSNCDIQIRRDSFQSIVIEVDWQRMASPRTPSPYQQDMCLVHLSNIYQLAAPHTKTNQV